jgi:hypothetical protein
MLSEFKLTFSKIKGRTREKRKKLDKIKSNEIGTGGAKKYGVNDSEIDNLAEARRLRRKPIKYGRRKNFRQVADEMNKQGRKNRYDNPWTAQAIAKTLTSQTNRTKANKRRKNQIKSLEAGIEFNLTLEYLAELWEQQKGLCAISGLEMIKPDHPRSPLNGSPDRIDSTKGYIEGNLQWLCTFVNYAKSDFDNSEIKKLLKAIKT